MYRALTSIKSGGKRYLPGDLLGVSSRYAADMVEQGLIEEIPEEKPAVVTKKTAPRLKRKKGG